MCDREDEKIPTDNEFIPVRRNVTHQRRLGVNHQRYECGTWNRCELRDATHYLISKEKFDVAVKLSKGDEPHKEETIRPEDRELWTEVMTKQKGVLDRLARRESDAERVYEKEMLNRQTRAIEMLAEKVGAIANQMRRS